MLTFTGTAVSDRFSTSCYKKYGANAQAIATAAENSQNKLKVRQDKLSGIF